MPKSRKPPKAFKAQTSSFHKMPESWRIEESLGADGMVPHTRLIHTRQSRVGQADEAFGTRVMSKGEHRFVFTIDVAQSPSGSGLLLGFADGDDNGYSRFKYGIRVSDGRCVQYPTPTDPKIMQLSEGFMSAATAQRAVGRRVEVVVDMDRRLCGFSVDGATLVDSGIMPSDLPVTLVPWCQIYYKADALTLSHHRMRITGATPPSPPKPVKVPPISRVYDNTGFDSGPWTP